jgi:hypothetical protein
MEVTVTENNYANLWASGGMASPLPRTFHPLISTNCNRCMIRALFANWRAVVRQLTFVLVGAACVCIPLLQPKIPAAKCNHFTDVDYLNVHGRKIANFTCITVIMHLLVMKLCKLENK